MARVVDLKTWRRFLKAQGLVRIRIEGGHEIWDYPDGRLKRPVAFSRHEKQIAVFQIGTNLDTLGLKMSDLDLWLGRRK